MACSAAIATGGTTAAVNIQRASDSHRCDIIATTGVLTGNTANCGTGGDNGQSVGAFCAATTCADYEWYDQSGNGNHYTNALWVGWRGVPAIVANAGPSGSSYAFYCASGGSCGGAGVAFTTALSEPITVSAVTKDGTSNNFNPIVRLNSNGVGHYLTDTVTLNCASIGSVRINATSTDGAFHATQYVMNSSAGNIYIDGTANTGIVGSSGNCSIGSSSNLNIVENDNADIYFEEILIYSIGLNSTQLSNMNSNQHTRYGF
jgi:hypothetical protein